MAREFLLCLCGWNDTSLLFFKVHILHAGPRRSSQTGFLSEIYPGPTASKNHKAGTASTVDRVSPLPNEMIQVCVCRGPVARRWLHCTFEVY